MLGIRLIITMAQIFNETPCPVESDESIYDSLNLTPLKDSEIAVRLLMPGKVGYLCFVIITLA